MGRRRSFILTGAGVLGALIWVGALWLRPPAPLGSDAVVAAVEAHIRETAAAVQARAETLAQMPRMSWAVATDQATVRDLTADELAFRPQPGEQIEIAQIRRADRQIKTLLHLPASGELALPVTTPGTHLVIHGAVAHVVTVVAVVPRERAGELDGAVAVSREMDVTPMARRLDAAGVGVRLATAQGAITLGRGPVDERRAPKVTLTGPVAAGVSMFVAGTRRSPARFGPLFLLVFSLAGGFVLWRRESASAARTAPSPSPSTAHLPPPPPMLPPAVEPVEDPEATPMARAIETSGRVREAFGGVSGAIPLHSGPVAMSMSGALPDLAGAGDGTPRACARHAGDAPVDEYRALFSEYLDLRRTCGEPAPRLDRDAFVEALRRQRCHLIEKLTVKDVSFRLAFDNGKAAIRFKTVA